MSNLAKVCAMRRIRRDSLARDRISRARIAKVQSLSKVYVTKELASIVRSALSLVQCLPPVLIFAPRFQDLTLHLRITILSLLIDPHPARRDISVSKDSHQRRRHSESPQRKAQNYLVFIGPVGSAHSVRNCASNTLPKPQDSSGPGDIAIGLRALGLRHQPGDLRLQDLVEELEADVDGESRVEGGAIAKVE